MMLALLRILSSLNRRIHCNIVQVYLHVHVYLAII